MGKDKVIGLVIMLVGILLIVFYIFWGPISLIYQQAVLNGSNSLSALDGLYSSGFFNWQWSVVLPLTIIVIAVGLLAAWIGFSMITTPPPVPLEELEEELEAEEAASKAEEKSE